MAFDLSFFQRGFKNTKLFATLLRARQTQNRELVTQLLSERMGALHGLPQKLGQTLAMMEDNPAASPLDKLNENAHAMPFEMVESCLAEHWGKPWQQILQSLDPKPLAASLGQVHRACDMNGRELAVKVAYPGIHQAVEHDLRMLGWLGKGGGLFMGFDWDGIRDLLLEDLQQELDYRLEAQNQGNYRELVDPQAVIVPDVFSELSGEQVLVTTWKTGHHLNETTDWPLPIRQALGRHLLHHQFEMLFQHGLVHADPHPGNYRFRRDPHQAIVIYDFGSVARFEKPKRLLLLRLIRDTLEQRANDPLETMTALGFQEDLLLPIRHLLPAICRVLFEPFLQKHTFDVSQWQRSQKIDHILGEYRWNFRFAGPPQLMFLVRMFQGMLFYLKQWQVQLAWQPLIFEQINALSSEINNVAIAEVRGDKVTFQAMAQQLHIKLMQAGATKVKLTFPLDALNRLATLMGPEIESKVTQAGIDLAAIVQRARASGLKPQRLFEWQDADQKEVRVWLE